MLCLTVRVEYKIYIITQKRITTSTNRTGNNHQNRKAVNNSLRKRCRYQLSDLGAKNKSMGSPDIA